MNVMYRGIYFYSMIERLLIIYTTHTPTNPNKQVIKARLQQRETGQSRWRYSGTWDCILKVKGQRKKKKEGAIDELVGVTGLVSPNTHRHRQIWRYEGALGFFKGCVPNVLKTAPSAAVTFVVYEECMQACNAYRDGGKARAGSGGGGGGKPEGGAGGGGGDSGGDR
jgi:uncharacterized membrane protein YgcG